MAITSAARSHRPMLFNNALLERPAHRSRNSCKPVSNAFSGHDRCGWCIEAGLTPTSQCAAGNNLGALMGLPLSVCGLMFGSTLARSLRWLLQNDSMQDICRRSGIFLEVFGLMHCLGEQVSHSQKPAAAAEFWLPCCLDKQAWCCQQFCSSAVQMPWPCLCCILA